MTFEPHDAAFAGIGVIEPRLRLFVVPIGPVKPYVTAGAASVFWMDMKSLTWKTSLTRICRAAWTQCL